MCQSWILAYPAPIHPWAPPVGSLLSNSVSHLTPDLGTLLAQFVSTQQCLPCYSADVNRTRAPNLKSPWSGTMPFKLLDILPDEMIDCHLCPISWLLSTWQDLNLPRRKTSWHVCEEVSRLCWLSWEGPLYMWAIPFYALGFSTEWRRTWAWHQFFAFLSGYSVTLNLNSVPTPSLPWCNEPW